MPHPVCGGQVVVMGLADADSLRVNALNAATWAENLPIQEKQGVQNKTGQMSIGHLASEFGCGGRI